ncbi:MAG TPA: LLM class flavin-dependent oxidoreductase [Acidimicrobiales bacterium]|nr:LLM class flavin-dependent oxidoreductase [Acidimicrobiales bacterium]
MEFGIFLQGYLPGPQAHDTDAEHTALTREMELARVADRNNFKFVWLTEHHGLSEYSHLASNEVHAGYLAAVTERIHIGAGIFNISPRVNHPVRTAEKVATLDHLTNRRFEFGTGRGAGSHEIGTLNIHDKESTRADYDDVIYEIVRMWEQKDYTYHGTHWAMDVPHNVLPKPWGPGHPPFWLAVGSPATWEKAGRLGQGALGFTFSAVHDVAPWIESYKKGISDCSDPVGEFVNDNVMITTAVRCATDRAGARAQACRRGNGYLPSLVALYHDTMPGRPGSVRWPMPPGQLREDQLDPLIDGGYLLCGSPEEICEQLQPFVEYGVDQVCFGLPGDATSYEEAIEIIETFGRHVIPEFDKDPVVSTDKYRATAQPKFAAFNRPPLEIPTLYSAADEG